MTGLPHLVDTAAVASALAVSEEWVRDHAAELGAIRVGDGPKGALRFEVDRVREALDRRRLAAAPEPVRRRPGPRQQTRDVELIPLPNRAA